MSSLSLGIVLVIQGWKYTHFFFNVTVDILLVDILNIMFSLCITYILFKCYCKH